METYNNVKLAYNKGYRVDEFGCLFNPKGKRVNGYFSGGYPAFCLVVNSKNHTVTIHRLQAYQKYNDYLFKPKIVVRHLNGIKTDNSRDNIAIGTMRDNYYDIPLEKRNDTNMQKKVSTASIRKYYHNAVVKFHQTNLSLQQTMQEFNISHQETLLTMLDKGLI